MEPTLVAPTATMEKKPCCHSPTYAALSFKLNRPFTRRAIPGFTLNSSPTNITSVDNHSDFPIPGLTLNSSPTNITSVNNHSDSLESNNLVPTGHDVSMINNTYASVIPVGF